MVIQVQSSDCKIAKEKSSWNWWILFDMYAHNCLFSQAPKSVFFVCFLEPGKNTHFLVIFFLSFTLL